MRRLAYIILVVSLLVSACGALPKNADEQIEESDRIKANILEMDNEMWNY